MKSLFLFIVFGFTFLRAVNSVDLHYALKEKSKIEYLNEIARLSLNSVNNDSIDQFNILTSRNSSIEKLILNDLSVDLIDMSVIKDMERITNNLISNNITVNCISIADNVSNTNGITYSKCFELDRKYRAIYKAGPYYRQAFNFDYGNYDVSKFVKSSDFNSSIGFFKKIKNEVKNDLLLEEKIKYMSIDSLSNLCDKISNNDNKTFVSKELVVRAIIRRATILSNVGAVAQCISYNFSPSHNYIGTISSSVASEIIPTGGEIASLMDQITLLNTQITALQTESDTAEAEYNTLFSTWNSTPPGLLKTILGVSKDNAYNKWQNIENQIIEKLAIITLLQEEIVNLGG